MTKKLCVALFCVCSISLASCSTSGSQTPEATVASSPTASVMCPSEAVASSPEPQFIDFSIEYLHSDKIDQVEEQALEFINTFGPKPIVAAFEKAGSANFFYGDLTGDGYPELAFGIREFFVFGCEHSQYRTWLTVKPNNTFDGRSELVTAIDMNLDSIPELVTADYSCGLVCAQGTINVMIYEWHGNEFQNLVQDGMAVAFGGPTVGPAKASIQDIDADGFLELLLRGEKPTLDDSTGLPEVRIYKWDGKYFVRTE